MQHKGGIYGIGEIRCFGGCMEIGFCSWKENDENINGKILRIKV